MKLTIREWTKADVPQILGLLSEMASANGHEFKKDLASAEEQYDWISKQPETYKAFVCAENSEILGFISLVFYHSILHRKGSALINELVVKKTEKGKGIGKKLLRHAIEYSQTGGWDEIEVGVESFNVYFFAHYSGIFRLSFPAARRTMPAGGRV